MQGTYNILLLGDSRVGKSALVQRFITGEFDEDYMPTIRIKLHDKTLKIDESRVTVQVVDTIGLKAEHDLPIIKKTIEAADGVFVLFDLTCARTQEMARFWFNEVRKQKINKEWMIVIGLGTKNEGDLEIDQDGIEAFSKECSAEMIVTSAKTGFNVSESFEMMARRIIKIQKSKQVPSKKPAKRESSKIVKSGKTECIIY